MNRDLQALRGALYTIVFLLIASCLLTGCSGGTHGPVAPALVMPEATTPIDDTLDWDNDNWGTKWQ